MADATPAAAPDGAATTTRAGGSPAVLDPPGEHAPLVADEKPQRASKKTHDGLTEKAGQVVRYLMDANDVPRGANVAVWSRGHSWTATIRWKPDTESGGAGGWFEMNYPNPGGGDPYVVKGRQQLGPMVDQALSIGKAQVFGDNFLT